MNSTFLGLVGAGLVMGLSSLGAAIAMGVAGSATVGAWKRCYKANRPVPMTLLALVGFPLTEVFYGFILMRQMVDVATVNNTGLLLSLGIGAGITIGGVAIAEGYVGAAAADALSDTGKGLAGYIAIVGICETVALFMLVLSMTILG
ncbi:MAG: V-type ATP synthase subunit K [Treponema sp.]|nr:V-type ATP synthase subunit K [Treponema sp.]